MLVTPKIDLNALLGRDIVCDCGRTHSMLTQCVSIGSGAIGGIGAVLDGVGLHGRALLVADGNTWEAAGEQTEQALRGSGRATNRFIFPDKELHTNEYAVGSVFMMLTDDIDFIVAVGSGTIGDICRFVAKHAGKPYITVGTAPSMDGYASTVSPITRGGFKLTWPGVAPKAIVGDTDVLVRAPLHMMAAGFGDVFGKLTALMDWRMSQNLTGEYRCESVTGTVRQAVDACMAALPGLPIGDAGIVERLMEALVLSGLAIQMVGDSRPASGCEHLLAHFFEMRDAVEGRHSALHGNLVGLGELIALRLYEKLFTADLPGTVYTANRESREAAMRRDLGAFAEILIRQNCSIKYYDAQYNGQLLRGIAPDWERWRAESVALPAMRLAGEEGMRRAGGPVRTGELGYSREETRCAILYAMEIREKFTLLNLAQAAGKLTGLAEELADEFH